MLGFSLTMPLYHSMPSIWLNLQVERTLNIRHLSMRLWTLSKGVQYENCSSALVYIFLRIPEQDEKPFMGMGVSARLNHLLCERILGIPVLSSDYCLKLVHYCKGLNCKLTNSSLQHQHNTQFLVYLFWTTKMLESNGAYPRSFSLLLLLPSWFDSSIHHFLPHLQRSQTAFLRHQAKHNLQAQQNHSKQPFSVRNKCGIAAFALHFKYH